MTPRLPDGPWCLACGQEALFESWAIDDEHVIVRCDDCGVVAGTLDPRELGWAALRRVIHALEAAMEEVAR